MPIPFIIVAAAAPAAAAATSSAISATSAIIITMIGGAATFITHRFFRKSDTPPISQENADSLARENDQLNKLQSEVEAMDQSMRQTAQEATNESKIIQEEGQEAAASVLQASIEIQQTASTLHCVSQINHNTQESVQTNIEHIKPLVENIQDVPEQLAALINALQENKQPLASTLEALLKFQDEATAKNNEMSHMTALITQIIDINRTLSAEKEQLQSENEALLNRLETMTEELNLLLDDEAIIPSTPRKPGFFNN